MIYDALKYKSVQQAQKAAAAQDKQIMQELISGIAIKESCTAFTCLLAGTASQRCMP